MYKICKIYKGIFKRIIERNSFRKSPAGAGGKTSPIKMSGGHIVLINNLWIIPYSIEYHPVYSITIKP